MLQGLAGTARESWGDLIFSGDVIGNTPLLSDRADDAVVEARRGTSLVFFRLGAARLRESTCE